MARSLFLHALLLAGTLGAAVPATHEIHEKRDTLHKRWTKRDRVPSHMLLPVRIGMAQNVDLDKADAYLMEVSDPSSSKFAKYWTPEEVIDAFQPSQGTVQAVHEWLTSSGIHPDRITHSDNKGWFAFYATNAEAEGLLHTEFYEYHDSITGEKMPSCDQYHVPKHLREHIDYVTPGIKLLAMDSGHGELKLKKRTIVHNVHGDQGLLRYTPSTTPSLPSPSSEADEPSSSGKLPANLRNCDLTITPECIQALYNFSPCAANTSVNPKNSMGIFEAEAQYYYQPSLNAFFANFAPNIPIGTHPAHYISIDGAPGPTNNASADGVEVELDLQLAYPIVYPQTITIFQEDDALYEMDPNQTYTFGFNTWLDAIDGSYCNFTAYGETGDGAIDPTYPDPRPGGFKGKLQCGVYQPTTVMSVSYGGQEADVPAPYQKRQCLEYLKLGLQGSSILFASGDAGVGNYPAPYGFDNPETGCLGPNGLLFNPTWPNNCPYVTNVGATKVYPGHTVYQPESAVFDPAGHQYAVNYSSGGGFSNLWPIPQYQTTAVANYFKNHNPPYKSYSAIVNQTSQIAALGKNGGLYNRIGRGIPDVAANGDNIASYVGARYGLSGGTSASTPIFASLINRINEERLNAGKKPVGFLNPTLYAHPEVLNDITNGTNPGCWTLGFSAVEGWDPVTGLGTPNYPKMLELYMSLP